MTSSNCLAVLGIALFSLTARGQENKTDSLEQKLESSVGETRVDILNQLTYEFISVDNDKVVRYSDEAIQLARKIKYLGGAGVAHTYRGVFEYQSGQFAAGRASIHTGLQLSQRVGDKVNEGYSYLQLGNAGLGVKRDRW